MASPPSRPARPGAPPPRALLRPRERETRSCRPPHPHVGNEKPGDGGDRGYEEVERDEHLLRHGSADGDIDGDRAVHPRVDDERSFASTTAVEHRGDGEDDGDGAT